MGKHFEITDEIMQKATAYMPIEEKAAYAKTIAEQCVVAIPTAEQNVEGEKLFALPYIKGENRELKALCLMNVLLSHYLNIDLKISEENPFNEEKYNYYAEGSILNQIERYKSNFDLKNKAFDLLADYKEFRKFVDIEINNLIEVNNDTFARFIAAISIFSSPENIAKAVEELKKVSGDYTKLLEEKKIILEKKNNTEKQQNTEKNPMEN